MSGHGLVLDRSRIGGGLADWSLIGIGLAIIGSSEKDCRQIGVLATKRHKIGGLVLGCVVGPGLALDWWNGQGLVSDWRMGRGLVLGWRFGNRCGIGPDGSGGGEIVLR